MDIRSRITTPCQQASNPDLWFAENPAELAQAQELCAGCPFAAACLEGALERAEPWGVWGGQILISGDVVAAKRGRGRPRKDQTRAA
nr:WhiB family transcriptional regulator [Actinomycetales bacterium]